MASHSPEPFKHVAADISQEANQYRWYILRYLNRCRYPASTTELSDYISSRVTSQPDQITPLLENRDLPVLAKSDVITYDAQSQLAHLETSQTTFADHIRRAIKAGLITHIKPLPLPTSPHVGSSPPHQTDINR
jgi:hypothetical protein